MNKKHLCIIGGGISGLAAAWYLRERFEVTLLEKEARLGGWIRSEINDGFLFEKGPRSLRPGKALELAEELGLDIVGADKEARKRYLYFGGKLRDARMCLLKAAPGLLTEWMKKKGEGDESIGSFFTRRFNSYAAEMLIDPLTSGIYAGDIDRLSMKSCFPGIYEMEQKHGSVTKGMLLRSKSRGGLYTFSGGMESLVRALEKKCGAKFQLKTAAEEIEIRDDGIKVLGEKADQAILALPAGESARLLERHDPELGRLLKGIQSVSVAVVNVGYNRDVLGRTGFGYLVPSGEKEKILGVVWDSSAFPDQNKADGQTRLTVMIGGAHMDDFDQYGKKDFIRMALNALYKHLHIGKDPDLIDCTIAEEAIPQYTVGHDARVRMIEKRVLRLSKRLHLIGNCFRGVSVNDCIAQAETLSKSLS